MPEQQSSFDALRDVLTLDAGREERAQRIAEIIRASGPYRWVGIYDVDAERGMVSNIAWSGPEPPAHRVFPITKGLTARAIASKRTVNVGQVACDPDYLTALGSTQSEIAVPVLNMPGGNVVGTLGIESDQRDAFGEQTERLLEHYVEVLRLLWVTR